jgi:hypothetical protein
MNNLHLAIIAALVMATLIYITGEFGNDMAHFQKTIRPDYQAYTEAAK